MKKYEKSFEAENPNYIDTSEAMEFVNYNHEVKPLADIVRRQMVDGSDCFDLYCLARVLEVYRRSRKPESVSPAPAQEVKRDRFDDFADEVEARIKFFTGDPDARKNLGLPPAGFTKKDMAFVARQWFGKSDSAYASLSAELAEAKKERDELRSDLYDVREVVTASNFAEMQQRAEAAEAELSAAREALEKIIHVAERREFNNDYSHQEVEKIARGALAALNGGK